MNDEGGMTNQDNATAGSLADGCPLPKGAFHQPQGASPGRNEGLASNRG
jgi:hypothetical protein